MPEFRRTILVDDVTPASDGDYTFDLPTDPISHIILTIKCLNDGANVKATLAQILGALESISIIFRGAYIYNLSAADLFALNCIMFDREMHQENVINTDNATRAITLILPFGRKLYDPTECFMATKRGEFQLKIRVDIADTGYDGLTLLFETVELPEASPANYLKVYTLTKTPPAVGDVDVDLPRGNKLLGILLWGTTIHSGTSWTNTIDKVQLLLNNVRKYYCETKAEALHGSLMEYCGVKNAFSEKFHMENLAAAYTQNVDTATEEAANSDLSNYYFLNFGINLATDYTIDTAPLAGLKVRITAGDTNPVRVLPIELVPAK
jgi:hypothetical protein